MTNLDDLMGELGAAIVRTPKRKPRAKANGVLTPAAARIVQRAAEVKQAEAASALRAAEAAEEAAYYRRFGRIAQLGKRASMVRAAMAGMSEDAPDYAKWARLRDAIKRAQAACFDQPVMPSDLTESGRFYRRAVWLGLSVGMLALDEADMVQEAAMLCLIKGQTAESDAYGTMPTLGGMYRNLQHAYHAALDLFRQHKRHGVSALYSFEGIAEVMGSDWIEANSARLDNLGYGLHDANEYPPVPFVPAANAEASRATLALARRESGKRGAMAKRDRAARDTLAQAATAPAGFDRDAWHADRTAIRVLINGGTLADVAEACNVSVRTLTYRLLALEGTLGATRYSSGFDSEPVKGHSHVYAGRVQSGTVAAFTLGDAPKPKDRHRGKGWSTSREGTRASEVVVTTR